MLSADNTQLVIVIQSWTAPAAVFGHFREREEAIQNSETLHDGMEGAVALSHLRLEFLPRYVGLSIQSLMTAHKILLQFLHLWRMIAASSLGSIDFDPILRHPAGLIVWNFEQVRGR